MAVTSKLLRDSNLEGHPNHICGSGVVAIWMNWWILPIGGASSVEGLVSTGLPLLVLQVNDS